MIHRVDRKWKAASFNKFTAKCEVFLLKVQSCKWYNNKYVIASTQITNIEIFAFMAVLVLSYWAAKFCLKTENTIENVKKQATF